MIDTGTKALSVLYAHRYAVGFSYLILGRMTDYTSGTTLNTFAFQTSPITTLFWYPADVATIN